MSLMASSSLYFHHIMLSILCLAISASLLPDFSFIYLMPIHHIVLSMSFPCWFLSSLFAIFLSRMVNWCKFHCSIIFSLLENKVSDSRVREIISNAVEIEREFVCEALSCDLVGRNLLGLKEASVKYELIHCLWFHKFELMHCMWFE